MPRPKATPRFYPADGEPIFLEGGGIKSGSGLGMRLATNYAPYEEVMKHSATAWKQAFMENAPIQKKCQAIV